MDLSRFVEFPASMVKNFRDNNMEVIFVRHNYEPGGNINEAVKPMDDEKVVSKDNINSFLDTGYDGHAIGGGISACPQKMGVDLKSTPSVVGP